MEYIELFYPDLHVEFDYGDVDWETRRGKEEFDQYVEYTYKIDKDSIKEAILNIIPEDKYQEITNSASDPDNELDIAYKYISDHFDELFNQYQDEILDEFRDDAEEEARKTINPEDYGYIPLEESKKMSESTSKIKEDFDNEYYEDEKFGFDKATQDKFEFLKGHKRYDGHFSKDIAVWDLDLTEKQKEYFDGFTDSDNFDDFWDENEELSRDIYISGIEMDHLTLQSERLEEPLEYDPFNFQVEDVDEAFKLWCNNVYDLYPHERAYNDEEMDELKQEFIDWINGAYKTLKEFDKRTDKLVSLLKKSLNNYIEQVEISSEGPTETLQEDLDDKDKVFDDVIRNKFEFLKNHKTHDGKFSKDVKVWDLDLTPKQEDYFYEFLESGALESFWVENEKLAKDIYQEGRSMGHLVLGSDNWRNEPDYYEADRFLDNYVEECFADWFDDYYGMSPEDYEESWPEDFEDAKEEFIKWINNAYEAVTGFDERADELVELFKQSLDDYIEKIEAPSDDLTETMFSEVEDIEEPELNKPEHDEINESYFDPAAKYLVVDVSGNYLNDFEDADEAIDWVESVWKAFEVQEITDDSAITIWRRNGFPDGDKDDFDECYDNASDELPKLEESVDFNPDFDDDFAGHHYTSYDLYKAQQEEEEKEYSDEEAFEERDPNRYDDEHAREWMKRHPHGWYNSESDYGVGDEDFDESWNPYDEEDDEGEPFEPYYVVIGTSGHWIGDFDFQDDAIEFAEKNKNAVKVDKQTPYGPKTIWTRKEKMAEKLSDKAEAISSKLHKIYYNTIDSLRDEEGKVPHDDVQKVLDAVDKAYESHQGDPDWDAAYEDVYKTIYDFDESLELNESYFDYNKYKLPRDVVKFIKETAEKDIKERLHFSDQDWSAMDSQDTSDWVMDRIEIKFPGWKWTDANMSYVETIVDDIFDDMRKQSFNEGVMSDLDLDVQEAGDKDTLITKLEYDVKKLRQEMHFLTKQAPREVGKGGAFDSQEEIDDALKATERALNRAELKLSILRGNK